MPLRTISADDAYAGFWWRALAYAIDLAILGAIILACVQLGLISAEARAGRSQVEFGFTGLLPILIAAVYTLGSWIVWRATPGKLAVRAEIADAYTGGRPRLGQLVGRYLAYAISALFVGLGFLWVALDSRKQGWHDKLAGTLVIRPGRR